MVDKAVDRAHWGARITSEDWGTHPTIWYAALISAAFFEKDTMKLYDMAMTYVPDTSPFLKGLKEVKALDPRLAFLAVTLTNLVFYLPKCGVAGCLESVHAHALVSNHNASAFRLRVPFLPRSSCVRSLFLCAFSAMRGQTDFV